MAPPVEFYRSGLRRGWRWRVRADNGQILAVSSESYARRSDAVRGMRLTRRALEAEGLDYSNGRADDGEG